MEERRDKQDAQRIILIKETIANAEKSLQAAKSLLAQLESKYTPQKKTYGVAEGGKVVEGTFDGQIMIGMDGRQYPVPANYASKSKLVEGDMLKLVITDDGNFIYKQIGPFKRKRIIGILKENKKEGGFEVDGDDKSYKVLLAAVTYHKASPGDEVALVVADNDEARWGAIENVIRKGSTEEIANYLDQDISDNQEVFEKQIDDTDKPEENEEEEEGDDDISEEVTPDLEEIEEELKKQVSKDEE